VSAEILPALGPKDRLRATHHGRHEVEAHKW